VHDVVTTSERRSRYRRRGLWNDDTLAGAVRGWAHSRPEGVAVVADGLSGPGTTRVTYAQLWRDADAMARCLVALGVRAHDVVSVQLPNRYAAVVTAVAVQGLGAVVNPLLPGYRDRELAHVWRTATPRVVVTPDAYRGFDHRAMVRDVSAATGVRVEHLVVPGDVGSAASADNLVEVTGWSPSAADARAVMARSGEPGDDDPASAVSELIFTSGTEATPKAIMHTEQTASFAMRSARRHLGLGGRHGLPGLPGLAARQGLQERLQGHGASEVVWMPSPVGHSTGFNYGLRFALHHGFPLVLQDQWHPEVACDLVVNEGVTYTLAATTFLQDLVGEAARRGIRLDALRFFGCGGAPVPPDLVEAAIERGIGVLRLYGSTEVLVGTWNTPGSSLLQRTHTDGCALPDMEIGVLDGDRVLAAPMAGADRATSAAEPPRPSGELEGELVTRGPSTSVGLFADPERTAATYLGDGWVRSGDLVSIDADGYLTVVGRKKEIIIRGGLNIAPREIEDLIVRFPEVQRVAVIGRPDDRLGERSCACVVLEPGRALDLATVVDRLRAEGLASYKLPEELVGVETLPTTASGKVQKHELIRLLAEREAADG
jgi:acyl-CoA synthetase (AMP-forming)/AMP-acid ligase II